MTCKAESYIKDAEEFIDNINNETLNKIEKKGFDISQIYLSLPKNKVEAKVIRRIKEPELKPKINKDLLIQLLSLFVKLLIFKMSNKFDQQADGLFIGLPSSPSFGEIYIQRCEKISVYNMIHHPRIWLCKFDDTFVITHHEKNDIPVELNKINSLRLT